MFTIEMAFQEAQPYESVSAELRSVEIDAFVRSSLRQLRERYRGSGQPFTVYAGCDKDDAQLVEVCVPTPDGRNLLRAGEIAFTVAEGDECEYPRILAAYDAVSRYLDEHGFEADGPPREVYLTELDADGAQRMQIVFPVRRRS
jgi:hypothetical protein